MEQLERDTVLGQSSNQSQSNPKQQVIQKSVSFIKQFDWKVQQFSEEDALKRFSLLADQDMNLNEYLADKNKISAVECQIKSSGLSKAAYLIIRGSSKVYQNVEVVRKYTDFYELREILVKRWPGCFIPPIPQLGNIGINQKQINKNKIQLVNSFLWRISQNEAIFSGQQFQLFFTSPQNAVTQNLSKLKAWQYPDLLNQYKEIWPQHFDQINAEDLQKCQEKIKKIEQYFMEMKYDITYQKDELKRLAQLRTKLDIERYNMLDKLLPQYENICMNWFNGKKQEKNVDEQQKKQEQNIQKSSDNRIYSSQKYRNALQGYHQDIVPEINIVWSLYQMFKFQQKQIESLLQTISQYRYIISDRKFYIRNIENNTQQLQDINNNKLSLKIFMLSGSEDDKKAKLANQTQAFENKLKMIDQLYAGITNLILQEIEDFQNARCQFYKKKMIKAFKQQAIFMGKLFNLYVQTQRI